MLGEEGRRGRGIWKAFVFLVAPITFKRYMIIEKLIICNYFQRACRCNKHSICFRNEKNARKCSTIGACSMMSDSNLLSWKKGVRVC
jgi:hypothetical protein